MESILEILKNIVTVVIMILGSVDSNTQFVSPIIPTVEKAPIEVVTPIEQVQTTEEKETLRTSLEEAERQARILEEILAKMKEQETKPEPIVEEEYVEVIPVGVPTPPQPAPIVKQVQVIDPIIKKSMSEIKIISPMPNKGLGRKYVASENIVDESNYIELGLIVRGDNGKVQNDVKVTIEATDKSQNKTMESTGNLTKIYTGEKAEKVHYYPFTYSFKTKGEHTIKFTANGVSEEVTLTAE